MFEFKDFQVVVQRESRFDFSVACKNFDLPVFKWLPCRHSDLLSRPWCHLAMRRLGKRVNFKFVHPCEILRIVIEVTPYYRGKHIEFTIIFLVPSWELTIISFGKLIITLAEQILSFLKTQICSPKFLCCVGMMLADLYLTE